MVLSQQDANGAYRVLRGVRESVADQVENLRHWQRPVAGSNHIKDSTGEPRFRLIVVGADANVVVVEVGRVVIREDEIIDSDVDVCWGCPSVKLTELVDNVLP
jgi:hypothetical protein